MSHMSLRRKLSEQAAELNHLRRLTSSEVSEATPETSFAFHPPQGPFQHRPMYPRDTKREDIPVRFNMCLLHIEGVCYVSVTHFSAAFS